MRMKINRRKFVRLSELMLLVVPFTLVNLMTPVNAKRLCEAGFDGKENGWVNPQTGGGSRIQNVTFRLLAVEQDFDQAAMRSAQYLIKSLKFYNNWQNVTSGGFRYTSYIHLLSNVDFSDIDSTCQPFYKGRPTKANVINEISTFLGQTLPGENNTLSVRIFYYVGHSKKTVLQGNTSYHMTLDQPILASELDQTLLAGALRKSNCTLIILDTSYSGGHLVTLSRAGRVILTACNAFERAGGWDAPTPTPGYWGWFTGHENAVYENGTSFGPLGLIGGIKKANDANNYGWKSAGEVFSFAQKTTIWYAANQTESKTQKPFSEHPQASYGSTGGGIPLVQHDASKPFPYNARPCNPQSSIPLHHPKKFEWRMHRHHPNRTGFSDVPGPKTSSLLWSKQLNAPIAGSAAVADGMVFVGTLDGVFYALDMTTGEEVWSFSAGTSIYSSPAVMDGMVFFASQEPGKIYALDEFTGLVRWTFEIPTGAAIYSSPVVADGKLFIGSSDGYVRALTQFEGVLVWDSYVSDHPDSEVRSSPVVADSMVFVGSSEFDSGVYALDEMTGKKIWKFQTRWQVVSTPAVADGRVFVGAENDDKVYALDEMTGTLIWSYYSGGWFSSPAVDKSKNMVIVICKDSRVQALDTRTGTLRWKSYIPGVIDLSSPAVSGNGYVYFGSTDKNIYCLNETTGEEVWNYATGGQITSSPSIVQEHVFISSMDGNIYCFGPPFPVHNVAVSTTTVSPTKLKLGNLVEINYTVENRGNVAETVTIKFAYNSSNVWTAPEYLEPNIIHVETITLASGANFTSIHTWNTTDGPIGRNSISVQAYLQPEEIDASDNIYIGGTVTVIMPADLDENGEIDIIDVVTVAKAFDSHPGDEGWNPKADFDNNGVIDIFDVVKVTKEFGKTYL